MNEIKSNIDPQDFVEHQNETTVMKEDGVDENSAADPKAMCGQQGLKTLENICPTSPPYRSIDSINEENDSNNLNQSFTESSDMNQENRHVDTVLQRKGNGHNSQKKSGQMTNNFKNDTKIEILPRKMQMSTIGTAKNVQHTTPAPSVSVTHKENCKRNKLPDENEFAEVLSSCELTTHQLREQFRCKGYSFSDQSFSVKLNDLSKRKGIIKRSGLKPGSPWILANCKDNKLPLNSNQ